MTPVLLLLAVLFQMSGILADPLYALPATNQFCEKDVFVSSNPYNGKVFLFPWEKIERTGDWFQARGYCATNCAEMVTIHSTAENTFFFDFMRSAYFYTYVWMGAEIQNLALFSKWSNEETANMYAMYVTEPNEAGNTCLTGGPAIANNWYNYYCYEPSFLIACQRPANWTTCGAVTD